VSLPFAPAQTGFTDPALDTCGCCTSDLVRPHLENRPGLPALEYRISTQATFLRRMLARLPSLQLDAMRRPLALLATRAVDDGAIALLDAWATAADVLTFYQERIANEGFLRTATERRSVLELARSIGYELNPGVAASTYLAFTVETAKGAPGRATVAEGVKVQSVPGQDERPQVFETVEEIEARAEWNVLRPQLTAPQTITQGIKELLLDGVNTGLQPGDAILVVGDERLGKPNSEQWDFRLVQGVTPYPDRHYTHVSWEKPLGSYWPPAQPAQQHPKVFALRQRAALFGYNAPEWGPLPVTVKAAYRTLISPNTPENTPSYSGLWGPDWPDASFGLPQPPSSPSQLPFVDLDAVYPKILQKSWVVLSTATGSVGKELYQVTRVSTNAVSAFTLSAKCTRLELKGQKFAGFRLHRRDTVVFAVSEELPMAEQPITALVSGNHLELDRRVMGLQKGRVLLVTGRRRRVRISDAARQWLRLTSDEDPTVRLDLQPGDSLLILEPPDPDEAQQPHPPDRVWHLMHRSGFIGTASIRDEEIEQEPPNPDDELLVEVARAARVNETGDQTVIDLAEPLRNSYDRGSVAVLANVARATHGETVHEVLGSGDASQENQRFTLKRPFVTYVPAATPTGGRSTLSIRVNRVLWKEVRSLYGLDPESQSYAARIDNDAKATVVFGDAQRGARLLTGVENVVATYRTGIGPDGEVRAGALTLLQTRPFGVREVTNPLPATGAAGPEVLEDARANAPLTVLTLERVVSLQDYEDFARAFAGIGKAQAIALWKGEHRLVYITVAAATGKPVERGSALYHSLVESIDAFHDPAALVEVGSYALATFSLEARVLVDPRYVAEDVVTGVRDALLAGFGFANRRFGQPATAADVLAIMQAVPGVLATDLNQLTVDAKPEPRAVSSSPSRQTAPATGAAPTGPLDWSRVPTLGGTQGSTPPTQVLPARPARQTNGDVEPAELLLINPQGITLTVVT